MIKFPTETAQDQFELQKFLTIVRDLDPERILEIGVWHGGTLWHWLQTADVVVAVDDRMLEADDWLAWAEDASTELHLIQGNSTSASTIGRVTAHGPYDFVFIDAAHDYESVRADWENYSPLVVPGGAVAFHDIAERPDYGVSRLWAEIKPGRRTVEIWAGRDAYCGIGIVWL